MLRRTFFPLRNQIFQILKLDYSQTNSREVDKLWQKLNKKREIHNEDIIKAHRKILTLTLQKKNLQEELIMLAFYFLAILRSSRFSEEGTADTLGCEQIFAEFEEQLLKGYPFGVDDDGDEFSSNLLDLQHDRCYEYFVYFNSNTVFIPKVQKNLTSSSLSEAEILYCKTLKNLFTTAQLQLSSFTNLEINGPLAFVIRSCLEEFDSRPSTFILEDGKNFVNFCLGLRRSTKFNSFILNWNPSFCVAGKPKKQATNDFVKILMCICRYGISTLKSENGSFMNEPNFLDFLQENKNLIFPEKILQNLIEIYWKKKNYDVSCNLYDTF